MRKAAIGFVMSVRPSACTEQLGSNRTDFRELCFFENLLKKI
jgi:hypothetical protein